MFPSGQHRQALPFQLIINSSNSTANKLTRISSKSFTSHPMPFPLAVRIPRSSSSSRLFLLGTNSPIDDQDLMDTNFDDELSVLDLFDPFRQCYHRYDSEETPPDRPSSTSPTSSLHFIKLRLKLSTSPEMKPFYQLVQNIRLDHLSKEVKKTFLFFRIVSSDSRLSMTRYSTANACNV